MLEVAETEPTASHAEDVWGRQAGEAEGSDGREPRQERMAPIRGCESGAKVVDRSARTVTNFCAGFAPPRIGAIFFLPGLHLCNFQHLLLCKFIYSS